MTRGLYDGPIVDAHHHLWDLSMGRHPWLAGGPAAPPALAALSRIAADHLPADYRRDADGRRVVATVHVEALWAGDPVEETLWLDRVARADGIAARCIANARLGSDDGPGLVARQAAFPRVAGVREILSHHPDPSKSLAADPDRAGRAAFRRDVGALEHHGLLLELMLYPAQAAAAAALARAYPDLPIVIDHCASPVDRDIDGMRRWRGALRVLAEAPNIWIKLSNPAGYDPAWTEASVRDVVRRCLDAFGAARAVFGTDHPVAGLRMGCGEAIDLFARVVQDLTPGEQRAVFHDNACRLYGIDLVTGDRVSAP